MHEHAQREANRRQADGQIRLCQADNFAIAIQLRLLLALDRFDPARSDLGAYLQRIARREADRILRTKACSGPRLALMSEAHRSPATAPIAIAYRRPRRPGPRAISPSASR